MDAFGLGAMVTVAAPVTVGGRRIGVVGIDVTLNVIIDFLLEEQWGDVMTILATDDGSVVLHPQLLFPDDLADTPVFPDIRNLEQEGGQPAAFDAVFSAVVNRTSATVQIAEARRALLKGDRSAGLSLLTINQTY